MNVIAPRQARAAILAFALAAVPASFAQAPGGAPGQRTGPASEASSIFQRHHAMAGIMKDMAQEMTRMTEEMRSSEDTPLMRRQMAAKMKRMSEMMRRMSGWADGPVMREPEMRRQFEEMRRRMDDMSKPNARSEPGRSK